MIKLYLLLFIEYSKIGLFALGGGYATLPFLFYLQKQYDWYTIDELTNMIAISNITPGPVGINMATYTGYTTGGLLGSIVATSSLVWIPFVITILITKLFTKFHDNKFVKALFLGLKPAACALLASIGLKLLSQTILSGNSFRNIDLKSMVLFFILFISFLFVKKNPLLILLSGAIGGILLKLI